MEIGLARTARLDFVSNGSRNGLPCELDRTGRERDRGETGRNRKRRQIAFVNLENVRRENGVAGIAEVIRGREMKRQVIRFCARANRQCELDKPGIGTVRRDPGHSQRQTDGPGRPTKWR